MGGNRAATGGKKHHAHSQDEKAAERCLKRYQELNREVKRRCRRDRRVYVESEAEKAEVAGKRSDARTLHEITRKLSGRFQNTCKPSRNEAVLLRSAEEDTGGT